MSTTNEGSPTGTIHARVWLWLGLLLAACAVVLVAVALRPSVVGVGSELAAPVAAPVAAPTTATAPPAEPTPTPVARPVHVSIPSIAVSTDLVRLGLQDDGTVQVPREPARAGWFEDGPPPGQPGSAVVLGHVDSVDGPAVFYRLAQLGPGDVVRVRLSDGSDVRFAVRRVATYANDDFPSREVYAGDRDRRLLNLVTCGGWYDADHGGWQGNVVVFTELVGS